MRLVLAVALGCALVGAYAWLMVKLFSGDPEPEPEPKPAAAKARKSPVIAFSPATCLEESDEPGEPAPLPTTAAPDHRAEILWPAPTDSLTSGFGPRTDPIRGWGEYFHRGIDIPLPCGTTIISADDGEVSFAEMTRGSGKTVKVAHAGGWVTRYAHLSRIDVSVGQRVRAGQRLGRSGSTGRSTGPHLHFEVLKGGYAYNPMAFRYRRLSQRHFGPRNELVTCYSEPTDSPSVSTTKAQKAFPSSLGFESYLK